MWASCNNFTVTEGVGINENTELKASVNVIGHVVGNVNLHKNTDAFALRDVKAQVLEGVIIVIISKN